MVVVAGQHDLPYVLPGQVLSMLAGNCKIQATLWAGHGEIGTGRIDDQGLSAAVTSKSNVHSLVIP